ncbi:MAG: hypothetical protein HZB73_00430 [Nitrosarchaeum sp.]|nr:hypothetical protein [Nitrosarchaeum sp.]
MDNSTNLISKESETIVSNDKIQKISICEIMKNNTSDIIQKLEVDLPILFQNYSDLYSRYLHSIQDLFGVCHLAEKQYFDKMQVDEKILRVFDDYWKFIAHVTESQIGTSTDFLKSYVQFRLSIIDSWDQYTHITMNTYAKMLSRFIQE